MDLFDGLRAFAALALVVGLMLGLAWALRRYGGALGLKAAAPQDELAVISFKTLDVRRKLAVVRWDGRDHLLCLGPAGDLVIASRSAPQSAAAPPATTAGEAS